MASNHQLAEIFVVTHGFTLTVPMVMKFSGILAVNPYIRKDLDDSPIRDERYSFMRIRQGDYMTDVIVDEPYTSIRDKWLYAGLTAQPMTVFGTNPRKE